MRFARCCGRMHCDRRSVTNRELTWTPTLNAQLGTCKAENSGLSNEGVHDIGIVIPDAIVLPAYDNASSLFHYGY